MIEGLVVALLLSFAVAATAALLGAGQRQQRLGRNYSQVQQDLREALRRSTRGIRHGYTVVGTSTDPDFAAAPSSGANQVIVNMTTTGDAQIQARYHLTNGTFYVQRADEAAPGAALITGVTELVVSYYQSIGAVRTPTDGTPANATEIRMRVKAKREAVSTAAETLVTLRNKQAGSP